MSDTMVSMQSYMFLWNNSTIYHHNSSIHERKYTWLLPTSGCSFRGTENWDDAPRWPASWYNIGHVSFHVSLLWPAGQYEIGNVSTWPCWDNALLLPTDKYEIDNVHTWACWNNTPLWYAGQYEIGNVPTWPCWDNTLLWPTGQYEIGNLEFHV